MPENMVPAWYIRNPPPQPQAPPINGTSPSSYLCANCRHIDFLALFKQKETDVMPTPREYIALGSMGDILSRATTKNCGFCRLVLRIVCIDATTDLPPHTSPEIRLETRKLKLAELLGETYYLCPIRFETTYNNPALFICSAKDVSDAARRTGTVTRPRYSMAFRPLHKNAPNLGRLLMEPGTIDFDWIRERMEMCDERDVGKGRFWHSVSVRGIDVDRGCIVDFRENERYVTLSYTWGNVKQLRLLAGNEKALRKPGGVWEVLQEVPQTIRDAITLTRKIGERFLWVDALCIVQDDPADLERSISQMGNIYRNSILTICACCGDDAGHGLPGVEEGSRTTEQAVGLVGEILLGNMLPDADQTSTCTWSTRGWTMQEKVLSQRKLQVTDHGVRWWCWHTITSEDENCRHSFWREGTAHTGMYFFKTEHDQVVSKIGRNCNMDIYAFMVSDYTSRNLTHQGDAEKAIRGVFKEIDGLFRGTFIAGLPDTELSAALLWAPLGSQHRRLDPKTGEALFPSWSWLGWVGHVAYPWLIERSLPMSETGSPLVWRDQKYQSDNDYDSDNEQAWFTGSDYRLNGNPDPNYATRLQGQPPRWRLDSDSDGWVSIDKTSESHRWLHPVLDEPVGSIRFFRFYDENNSTGGGSSSAANMKRLHLRTMSVFLKPDGEFRVRKENYDHLHKMYYMRVRDMRGFHVGYIHTPDPDTMADEEKDQFVRGRTHDDGIREFMVLSRSSTNPDPRVGKELLHTTPIEELNSVYSMAHVLGRMSRLDPMADGGDENAGADIDDVGHFDTRLFDATTPWGMFNVMMVERDLEGPEQGRVATRVAVGRIHVAAFMGADPFVMETFLE
ncbi:heterokaryon incompatibility protein-domain-containing protein [Apodospora peruviana]|uniref:Heterokaryon incompatibility protein-domain-containing protein n=1 Tax=Apodospora peruviana TaxID=516989 RepID=A0AAE0HZS7_9PEZI|nr:heterokaryon incompatibility protein-domain-containing protein [Apodospora peruviana]